MGFSKTFAMPLGIEFILFSPPGNVPLNKTCGPVYLPSTINSEGLKAGFSTNSPLSLATNFSKLDLPEDYDKQKLETQ